MHLLPDYQVRASEEDMSATPLLRLSDHTVKALCVLIVCALSVLGQTASDHAEKPALTVGLSARTSIIDPGGRLTLRVTVTNQGPRELFINKDISVANQKFVIYIKHGLKWEGPLVVVAGDFRPDGVTPFATLLSKHLIALAPGMFYRREVDMDPREYPQLRIPGKYLVKGEYSSRGFHEPGEGNPLIGREEEVSKLPFKAWEGRVETNSIWIEVKKPSSEH